MRRTPEGYGYKITLERKLVEPDTKPGWQDRVAKFEMEQASKEFAEAEGPPRTPVG
jgi:hypothetical protein